MEGPARRGLSGILLTFALLASVAATVVAGRASAGDPQQTGVWALLGGTPQIVSKFWADHANGLTATLKVRQFKKNGKSITNYDIDMQKYMHMVVVRDDFATFSHLHPALDAETGTFSATFTKAANHRYYVYADSMPNGIGQQVFRFTMESDGPLAASSPSLAASSPDAKAGPYTVVLAKTTVRANSPQLLYVTVVKGDDPASDLVPYLGAAAHAVFINTSTLQYVHLHPTLKGQKMNTGQVMTAGQAIDQMESNSKAGPFMQMQLPALPAGTYKLWLQFKGGADQNTYTAPFTLVAQ